MLNLIEQQRRGGALSSGELEGGPRITSSQIRRRGVSLNQNSL